MTDRYEKILIELLKKPGNRECADCGSSNPEWASYNIGIFLCTRCASVHRSMGAHISKVKHLKLDRWEDSQLERMEQVGNAAARARYEQRVPACYRRPTGHDDPQILVEQWIRGKYQREEFCHIDRQPYTSGTMTGFLMKRGKEDSRYQPRRFVLSEADDTLKYYVKERGDPKAVLRISEINVALAPIKMNNQNSMQLSYLKDGTTRHIFLYHDDPEILINWYMAIRCAKLHRLQIAFPSANDDELTCRLTRDFPAEGWLWKTGPRHTDAFKKRWFTLDNRTLMYHDDPLDAYPKGEIFIGNMMDGYSVRIGCVDGVHEQGFMFTLRTPDRCYNLSAMTELDRDLWITVLHHVIERSVSVQDTAYAGRLRKRNTSNSINIFSSK